MDEHVFEKNLSLDMFALLQQPPRAPLKTEINWNLAMDQLLQ